MDTVSTPAEDDFLTRIKRLKIIIIILSVMVLALLAYLTLSANSESDFSGLSEKQPDRIVPPSVAEPNIEAYRSTGAYARLSYHKKAKVFGVLHDTARFRKYIDITFDTFALKHPPKKGYSWMIGIYPMVCKADFGNNKEPRIGVYIIPTMIKTGAGPGPRIIDYMDAVKTADSIYYPARSGIREARPDDEFIFDEGQLWP